MPEILKLKRRPSMNSDTLFLKTTINKLDFLKKKVTIQWTVWEQIFVTVWKQIYRKISDPHNHKEHHQSFIRKKNTKLVKHAEIITHQPKIFENINIVNIKLVMTEYPKINYPRL